MQPDNQQPTQQPTQPGTAHLPGVNDMQPAPATNTAIPQQAQPSAQAKSNPASTQNSLLFSEMRDNMIIMNDGSFRSIVLCHSINFDLMSPREREGVEYSYQNFLNSLYFPTQILIRSRRVDIGPYIDRLLHIRRSQDNMLLNVLMDDYISFIDILAQEANIMDKSFYIVVPYYPEGDLAEIKKQAKGLFDSFFGGNKGPQITKIDQEGYKKAKDELKNRIDSTISGLYQMGVKGYQLNTKQLGELFYNSYNPDVAPQQPISTEFGELTSIYVQKKQTPEQGGG